MFSQQEMKWPDEVDRPACFHQKPFASQFAHVS
jgi:hypothetical protein